MLALLKDVPLINHPVFRIVLGVVVIAAGLALHLILAAALGGFLLVMGITRAVTTRHQKGQLR